MKTFTVIAINGLPLILSTFLVLTYHALRHALLQYAAGFFQ